MKKFPILYKRTSKGGTQQWQIVSDADSYTTVEGMVNGKLTTNNPHLCQPKNPGKANATTAAQQAEKEAEAKWDKKLKQGYVEDVTAIDSVTFRKPMKGDKWKDRQDEVIFPIDVQDKCNGIRCQNEVDAARSTGGEIFHTIPHIRAALSPIFEQWPEAFIDGEAFNYGLRRNLNRLIELVSVMIKPKDLTPALLAESEKIVQLHVFDGWGFGTITKDTPYKERHAAVTKLIKDLDSKYLYVLKSTQVDDVRTLLKLLKENKKTGGEGLMVRWGACEYKHGRSKYLLKLKHFDDAEFEVLDIQEGNANWTGCAKRVVLKLPAPCKGADGKIMTSFASNIDGDVPWLRRLFLNRKEVIGEMATCEYQQLSEYGIPQIPWVRAIRNYE